MKTIPEIKFGFSDAENYRRRENKDLFNQIFLRTDALEGLIKRNIFFLVGEKGTGKTAYAVYLSNSPYKGNLSTHHFIRETDYHKFISLKQQNHLSLSDYTDIWKVILYLLLSDDIYSSSTKAGFGFANPKLSEIRKAVDEYYNSAFASEIPIALQFVENSSRAAKLVAKYTNANAELGSSASNTSTMNFDRFQTNLLFLKRKFEDCLSSIKLKDSHTLFVDGIDIRPSSVPYPEYLDCVKGLANAVWSINNDFFPKIRDSQGRLKVVLLLRPDIFNSLGLQNRNTKLNDNSVVLDWTTNYTTHRTSNLFRLADRMFSAQQLAPYPEGVCWDYYFPFDATNVRDSHGHYTSFISFLRYSLHRPRDILTALDLLGDLYDKKQARQNFAYEDLFTSDFKRQYGEYLLGEIKDSLSFYYDESEFEMFLKFFEYLDGSSRFTYEKYLDSFDRFTSYLAIQGESKPSFMKSAEEFLQFLFDQNVLCYIEHTIDESFIRWCFQERTPSNISPKVKTEVDYEIHYGLANVLNTGKPFRNRRPRPSAAKANNSPIYSYGHVKSYNPEKKYGFITQDGLPVDIYFAFSSVAGSPKIVRGQSLRYVLSKDAKGRLEATDIVANE